MKVLIVEDERRLAKALHYILTEAGYEAAAVYTGDDGLHYASTCAYDLIVLDVMHFQQHFDLYRSQRDYAGGGIVRWRLRLRNGG